MISYEVWEISQICKLETCHKPGILEARICYRVWVYRVLNGLAFVMEELDL